ncbi:hypothetical protein M427DRAFT_101559 [Gonapodya prolifera JEL478]|uniref:MYND-type domain-containing protein n=1 Tax=Gonapodya prolifera (strain JEL478) TaxID=1344416 RepID=A0A139A6C1_GONPJ|nr:hypothetical protein M427DRAFT_101559 [Gonapodya prolifera JEL478]|eukprot:KXS12208.1 hypothetical protein M427DRAFT_101559 [Gonapodya prolifera JEL478]
MFPNWELAKTFVTRASIAPVFSMSLIEERTIKHFTSGQLIDAIRRGTLDGSGPWQTCRLCEKKKEEMVPRLLKCGGCAKMRYCCKDCQVKDWKRHKVECSGNKRDSRK